MPVDLKPFIAAAIMRGQSIGRPQVADAMIAARHVTGRRDAFERWLGAGRPAFVDATARRRSGSSRSCIRRAA
jgi:hypothetical protein